MDEYELLARFGLALAAGFLIGVERGWREREEAEGGRAAGLRTFTLIALAGAVFAYLAEPLGQALTAAAFFAVAAIVAAFRWREANEEDGRFGATTVIAALVTFGLGAMAIVGDMLLAAAAGVVTAAILAAKGWLHAWLRTLRWEELRAALILLAMTFVALPILPDRGFGPYEALNPRGLWLMTISIAAVSFVGYVALRVAGSRYGPLIAGVAGGVVSSTITTLDLARRAKAEPGNRRTFLAGALAASAVMFARVAVVVGLFGPELLPRIAAALAAALVVNVAGAVILDRPWEKHPASKDKPSTLRNPFDLGTVLLFGLLLAVIMLLSAVLTQAFGGSGAIALAAVAGLADVDAITLSMTQVGAGVSATIAAVAILVAVASNSIAKGVLATIAGGPVFGVPYLGVSAVALIAGAIAAVATGGMV